MEVCGTVEIQPWVPIPVHYAVSPSLTAHVDGGCPSWQGLYRLATDGGCPSVYMCLLLVDDKTLVANRQ